MRPVRAGDWVVVPVEDGEDREVATVLRVEPGALVVEPQGGGTVRRVPAWQATTPSNQRFGGPVPQRLGRWAT